MWIFLHFVIWWIFSITYLCHLFIKEILLKCILGIDSVNISDNSLQLDKRTGNCCLSILILTYHNSNCLSVCQCLLNNDMSKSEQVVLHISNKLILILHLPVSLNKVIDQKAFSLTIILKWFFFSFLNTDHHLRRLSKGFPWRQHFGLNRLSIWFKVMYLFILIL